MRGFPVSRAGIEKRLTKLVRSVITRAGHPARYLWPQLLARIYGVFPLKCSGCGGRVRLVGFITEPATVDHIALFRRPEEIRALIATSGMRVHEELLLPYHGKTVAESLEQSLPMNIALLLRHAGDS